MDSIYLDHNATTPAHPRVIEEVARVESEFPGNPESGHAAGRGARAVREDARERVARLLGIPARGVLFTSGGTESDNLALRGVLAAAPPGRSRLVITGIEHPSVANTARSLESGGVPLTIVDPEDDGRVNPDRVAASLTEDTALLSVMLANHETGALQPVREVSRLARERGILVHCDAVQAAGKVPVDLMRLGVDLASLSAHKFRGPAGIGALYVRPGVPLSPVFGGGIQEGGLRPGTSPVPLIAGLALALELAHETLDARMEEDWRLTLRLVEGLRGAPLSVRFNGPERERLPNTVNIEIPGVAGAALQILLDRTGIMVSTGSACASGAATPSPVLMAMGRSREQASSCLRISLGAGNTEQDIDRLIEVLLSRGERLRTRERSP